MRRFLTGSLLPLALAVSSTALAQPPSSAPPKVEKTGENQYRIGQIKVDTALREISVPGHLNDVTILEFVANTEKGFKAYESAVTLATDGVTFNTALLLIGLDKSRARVPVRHFDPEPPRGDPVELWVEWRSPMGAQKIRVESLLLDKRTNQTMPEGPWVYTGSAFMDNHYMADMDGVLIGFVHSPSPVIENPRSGAVSSYGSVVLNRRRDLQPGMPLTLIVKALPLTAIQR